MRGEIEMKTRTKYSRSQRALAIAVSLIIFAAPVLAQRENTNTKTDAKMLYHDGPIARGNAHLYLIWYGGWSMTNGSTQQIVVDFSSNLGGSDYFQINHGYP